jgi:hypothetical protein
MDGDVAWDVLGFLDEVDSLHVERNKINEP